MDPESTVLTEAEEKAMVGILYNHITYATTMEIFGELTHDGITRVDTLRGIFIKLIRKYSLAQTLTEDAFLLLGMPGFVSRTSLENWAGGTNGHLKKRAEYFLKKWH